MWRVIFLFLVLVAFKGNAQSTLSMGINIRIACGFAGVTSEEVRSFQRLVKSKSYDLLKQKLSQGNKTEVILSAISLKELQAKGLLQITAEEQERINEISSWQNEYNVCFNCTQHFKGTVSELLNNKYNPAYLLIMQTINKAD
jgi:hypothetical protein